MKFYVIETDGGETVGCELTKKAAHEFMALRGYDRNEYSVEAVETPVTADTVRRLLGNLGGYWS
jgi:Ni,Fe-hydrogenase III small subunit